MINNEPVEKLMYCAQPCSLGVCFYGPVEEQAHKKNSEKGFTFVEMILVVGIIAVMFSIVFGSISSMRRMRQTIYSHKESSRVARHVLDKIHLELSALAKIPLSTEGENSSIPHHPYEIAKNILDLGDQKIGSTDGDYIEFVTSSGGQEFFGANRNFGYVQVRYELKDLPEDLKPQNWTHAIKPYALVRSEIPAEIKNSKTLKKQRIVFPLATNVAAFNLRYFTEEEWKEEISYIPKAIEVTISFVEEDGNTKTWKSAIAIPPGNNK